MMYELIQLAGVIALPPLMFVFNLKGSTLSGPPQTHVVLAQVFPSPTPTLTPTPLPTATPTPTPTPSPTPTPKPTPIPTPTPIPVTSQQLDRWFTDYANKYSIDRNRLWLVAVCESRLRPNARNGQYIGLYQFSVNTWKATRMTMNEDPNPDLRFNPEESIKTAAFKISTQGLRAWPECGR